MISQSHETHHIVWPAEAFFWALLDASRVPTRLFERRPGSEQLGYLFEAELPCPIDEVQAVFLELPGRQYLACGIEHTRLQALPPEALTLRPDRMVVPMTPGGTATVDSINFLYRAHEPIAVARARHAFIREFMLVLALIGLALGLSVMRRISAFEQAATDLLSTRDAIHARLYASSPASTQPHSLRLLAELRQLRATRSSTLEDGVEDPDSIRSLEALLRAWPHNHPIQTESVSVTASAMTIAGVVSSSEPAQAFAAAFTAPEGWMAQQPQVSSTSDGVRLTLRFQPAATGPHLEGADADTPGATP